MATKGLQQINNLVFLVDIAQSLKLECSKKYEKKGQLDVVPYFLFRQRP